METRRDEQEEGIRQLSPLKPRQAARFFGRSIAMHAMPSQKVRKRRALYSHLKITRAKEEKPAIIQIILSKTKLAPFFCEPRTHLFTLSANLARLYDKEPRRRKPRPRLILTGNCVPKLDFA